MRYVSCVIIPRQPYYRCGQQYFVTLILGRCRQCPSRLHWWGLHSLVMHLHGKLFELTVHNNRSEFTFTLLRSSHPVHSCSCELPSLTICIVGPLCSGYDCGVFVMAFMDLISIRATGWQFTQANVRLFRDKCLLSLVRGRIAHFPRTVTGMYPSLMGSWSCKIFGAAMW